MLELLTLPQMGNSLKRLRLARGWTAQDAADQMGLSRGQFVKLERGERGLTERTIELASKAFGVPAATILSEGEIPARPAHDEPAPGRDMPVYAAAEGGPGEMVVDTEPIDFVPRPWFMGTVREAYAVRVVGESMVPAFEPGDLAIVNPRLPAVRNQDVILIANERHGEFTATIKRLLRWTDKDWLVCQYNPPRGQKAEFTLPRSIWPKALRVVARWRP